MLKKIRQTGDFTTDNQIFRLSGVAIIIGAICAFIAIALLKIIGLVTNLSFYHRWSFSFATPTANHLGVWEIVVPVIGGLIIGFIARFGSEKIRGHGIPEAIEAMLINESKIKPRVALWKPISAAISIGTGGPFGAEGPIIMTGGSVGSLISQFFHFSSIERRILLVAGAAGGMSAVFAAPVSSVLFAVELLIFEFKPRSLVPIALASATADAVRIAIKGGGPLFGMPELGHVGWHLIIISICIGLIGSILAVLLTYAIYGVEDLFRKLPIHWMWWPAIGGIVIGVGGIFSPRSLGVGYDSISAMLNVKLTISVLIGLVIVKTIIWVVALGSGTSGGILAPILIIGGSLGALVGQLTHAPHPGVWALLGMAAIFSGVTRTPFTSVIFPLELTHNLGALLPLLIASVVACGISSRILPRSILTEKIHRRGLHMTREYTVDPLQMHYVREFMSKPSLSIISSTSVSQLSERLMSDEIAEPWFNIISETNEWLGIVQVIDVLRQLATNPDRPVSDCLAKAPTLHETATVKAGLDLMLEAQTAWVQIVDQEGLPVSALTIDQLLHIRRRALHSESRRYRVFQSGSVHPTVNADMVNQHS